MYAGALNYSLSTKTLPVNDKRVLVNTMITPITIFAREMETSPQKGDKQLENSTSDSTKKEAQVCLPLAELATLYRSSLMCCHSDLPPGVTAGATALSMIMMMVVKTLASITPPTTQ